MLYCSTDMACDRCNFYVLVWRASFCPFTPLTAQKIKIKKKWKKHLQCTKNYDQMMYGSWDMVCDEWTDGKKTYRGWCPT